MDNALMGMMQPQYIWAVVGIVLLLSELAIPGFIIFFFGLGALITALTCGLAAISINHQLILFLAASLLMLVGLRRWLKNIFTGFMAGKQNPQDNPDNTFTGKTAVVRECIKPGCEGKVELNGTDWRAESEEMLSPGDRVIVTGRTSLVLSVRKKEDHKEGAVRP